MIFIGIDPGVHGGLAFIDGELKTLAVYPMPIIGDKEYDIQQMKSILKKYVNNNPQNCFGTIEKQHPMPGEGLPRTFKTGTGFGILLGLFAGLDIPHQVVSAKSWQNKIFKGLPLKQDTKVSSAIIATRLFPNTNFRASERARTIADGMTDATCIAVFTQRFYDVTMDDEDVCRHRVLEANPQVCISCGAIL